MAGYILYNGIWNRRAVPDTVRRLAEAGERERFSLTPLPNTAVWAVYGPWGVEVSPLRAGDTVLCFDKDVRLLCALEQAGVSVYNSAEAVALCDDKAATHRVLSAAGLPMPDTFVAPMTYLRFDETGEAFLRAAEERLSYPLVCKECYGSLGEQVWLIRSPQELRVRAARCGSRPFLLQRYVAASCGRDLRLYVVGGRVAAAMERRSETDFRANIARGGVGTAYTPTDEEAALAVRCCAALGLDFGGVDLLREADGSPLVCEVNSGARLRGITQYTGVDMAAEIVRYVRDRR